MNRIFLFDSSPIRLDSMALLISSFPGCSIVSKGYSHNLIFQQLEDQIVDICIYCSDKCDDEVLHFLNTYHSLSKKIKLIVVTNSVSRWIVKHMKQMGVDGYIVLKAKSASLSTAIESVSEGKKFCCPEVSSVMVDHFVDSKQPELTVREQEIMYLLSSDLLSKEIAFRLNISVNTVETHRKMLIRKFDVRSTIGLVKKAMDYGII
ncbi:MAG: response regulator transcription factor [Flavobacteriales bacterium]